MDPRLHNTFDNAHMLAARTRQCYKVLKMAAADGSSVKYIKLAKCKKLNSNERICFFADVHFSLEIHTTQFQKTRVSLYEIQIIPTFHDTMGYHHVSQTFCS